MEKSTMELAFEKPLKGNFDSYETETLLDMYKDYQKEFSTPAGSEKYKQNVREGKEKDSAKIKAILESRGVSVE